MRLLLVATVLVGAVACGDRTPNPADAARVVGVDELVTLDLPFEFNQVRDIVVKADTAWVLDTFEPFVTRVVLGEEEDVLRFGSSGRGPGELRGPVAMQRGLEGLDVWDPTNNTVTTYGADGEVVRSRLLSDDRPGRVRDDIRDVSHIDPWRVRRMEEGVLYAQYPNGFNRTMDAIRGALILGDAALGEGQTVVTHADYVPRDASSQVQFAAMPLWDACSEGPIALWDARSGSVHWLEPLGGLLSTAVLDLRAPEVEADDVERFLRYMARHEIGPDFESQGVDFEAEARRLRPLFRARGTPVVDLRCADDGTVWLQMFDMSQDPLGRGPTWLRVQRDAQFDFTRFPSEFQPFVFTVQGLAVGVVDQMSGQSVALWRGVARGTQ
jgi:hypothetical protein